MDKILPVYGMVFAILLAAAFLALKSDGLNSHRLAKIRVWIEDSRRKGVSEPHEEDFDLVRAVELLLAAAMLLLICLLLSKV